METNTLASKTVLTFAERIEIQACERAADLLWNDSMDDYAAAIVTKRDDGAAVIRLAPGVNTWNALACAAQDYGLATKLADMRIPDAWRMFECPLYGRVQVRPIEDESGNAVAFLFKR